MSLFVKHCLQKQFFTKVVTSNVIVMSLQTVAQHLNPSILKGLYRYGYCIIDNALPDTLANNILSEIKPLQEFDIMYPCHTHVVNNDDSTKLISKSNVWELELHSCPELEPICTDLSKIMKDKSLCQLLNNNQNKYKYTHQTLKILYSINNGCFPIHFDSDPLIDLRRITAILYLNNKTEIDGGELRLYPLLSPPIDIIPKYNRLVLFSSCFMLHRTLTSMQPRYALNFWLHIESNKVDFKDDNLMDNNSINPYQYLLQSKYLKCIAKLLYDDEWTQSIIDSHRHENDVKWLIDAHKNDVKICKNVLSSLDNAKVAHNNLEQIITNKDLKQRYLSASDWQNCEINWMC